MSDFLDFLRQRLEHGAFTTEDVLASLLPLLRQVAATHRAGQAAPLAGVGDLRLDGVRVWYEEGRAAKPKTAAKALEIDPPTRHSLEVVDEKRWDVGEDQASVVSLQVGKRGEPVTRPTYLPGYVSWEHELDHHDPLTDVFSAGMLLASVACALDFSDPEDLERFVRQRRNLFDLNPNLHPVVAKAIVRMTELSRHRRPQDLQAVVRTLEHYRDQEVDFDFDLARFKELKTADVRSRRALILGRLQQRLFEISRRNRLLHFRPTMQTVNLTWASVPLSFNVQSIRAEQVLTWNAALQQKFVAGESLSLNQYLRFEEAIYLPGVLDAIRTEARHDQAEYGFAQLRLVACFLRWSNLKDKQSERFDSPLVLVPVRLVKSKGVRDVHHLEPLSSEAEVNPILRHYLKQLYDVDLPETIDLATTALDVLHEFLAAKIQASEPGVSVVKIDRPRIQLVHARARRRLDQYQRRSRLTGRGVRTFGNLDYSYSRDNFHPLGLRLFQTRVRAPEVSLHHVIEDKPRPRTSMAPGEGSRDSTAPAPPPPSEEQNERLLYAAAEEETNPYQWEFDLCSVTLGNFRYRKMSLVRDYETLLANERAHPAFDVFFSLDPRPAQVPDARPLPLEESYPIVSCDPTQASAIALARAGHHCIIQGPPGTGKSQTITNLIADYVVRGKRVLFVCEKRAAIDVVFHRLKQAGLDELCCLIHDSQADKKAFVMELKQTYEQHLECRDQPADVARRSRKELLEAIQKEITPLSRFDAAMRGVRPEAGVPTRSLLERAVELGTAPQFAAAEEEQVPRYSLWHEHHDRLSRLAATLQELHAQDVFARHPLRGLQPRFAGMERPIEAVSAALDEVEQLLDELHVRLAELNLPEPVADSLARLQQLLDLAVPLHFLAEHEQLALLRPKSSLSRQLAEALEKIEEKDKELEQAQAATKGWRSKLPAAETVAALDQAKKYEGSMLRFFQPGWWRLRGILHSRYDFQGHAVKPSWIQALETLRREQTLAAARADLEAEARRRFASPGGCHAFAQQVAAARALAAAATKLPAALRRRMLEVEEGQPLILDLVALHPLVRSLTEALDRILAGGQDQAFPRLRDELVGIAKALDELPGFLPCLSEMAALPEELARAVRQLPLPPPQLEAAMVARSVAEIYRGDRTLARFTGQTRGRHVQRLEQAYGRFGPANAAAVLESVRQTFLDHVATSSLPHAQLTAEQKEMKVGYNRGRRDLEHEFGKSMRYKAIRELAAGEPGTVLRDLKPVWLMSPLSVSDTLPFDAEPFDVVIFDEASQVTLEEAVPSLFRARQVIVVGDEMQLPPTNFFATKGDDDQSLSVEDDNGEPVEYDLSSNSFLNHAGRTLPTTMLGWHYRSRSETLISFSNAAFYQGRLLTVPEVSLPPRDQTPIRVRQADDASAHVERLLARPVTFHLLERGLYVERRNAAEAEYIAYLVRELLRRGEPLTIGVVAFSEAQQGEIERALNGLAREDPEFQALLEAEYEREQDGQFVGLLVKNLENIQGDERDVVIISTCYGPGPTGKMLMNFGPINQSGGERRLNVAFSRAKKHVVLVSSILSHAITNDYNDGARCLKNYLRYAEAASCGDGAAMQRVLRDLAWNRAAEQPAGRRDVVIDGLAAALRQRGCVVELGLGQSHFRCDLAVRREEDGAFRLGILVDTDAFYQQTDLVERDVLKPKLLRSFGWTVAHVLTKDWHERRSEVLEKLERLLGGDVEEAGKEADEMEPVEKKGDGGTTQEG